MKLSNEALTQELQMVILEADELEKQKTSNFELDKLPLIAVKRNAFLIQNKFKNCLLKY